MVTRTVTRFIDDVDGSVADETVTFSLDGVQYEIDLSAANAEALREAVAAYREAARRTGGRRATGRAGRGVAGIDTKAVRAWAAGNGIELSGRGRIPGHVVQQYRDAGN